MYESQWRMATHSGDFFGDIIWVILTVEPAGTYLRSHLIMVILVFTQSSYSGYDQDLL